MSLLSRLRNALHSRKIDDDIEDELRSHFEDARAEGRDPEEVQRAFGSTLRVCEAAHDAVVATWLESLVADARFGFRQLVKNKNTAAVAILSLGLGMGACMAAFRLIDAMMLRPLPVADPQNLYVVATKSTDTRSGDAVLQFSFNYPGFRLLRAAVQDQAAMMAISYPQRINLTYSSDEAMERVYQQYISGWTFTEFGLRPAIGRLFTESDDVTPGAHPYAVISYEYWTRRFGRDPKVLGSRFRSGQVLYEVIGVAPEGFTGTEAGTFTDVFLPTMMYNAEAITSLNWNWLKPWVRVHSGVRMEEVRERLFSAMLVNRQERAKQWGEGTTPREREAFQSAPILLMPATGASELPRDYGPSAMVLALLVVMVLLIACVNVANLMTAQAAARAREMALRVSIGAGRVRLIQLVLIESAWIGAAASVLGIGFAWWAAPMVVGMINPVDSPVRLDLPADVRVSAFAVALTLSVTALFGLVPALRASGVKPASALKGGDIHAGPRLMNALVAAQVAFCILVQLVAGLFISTFDRLANRPLGFSPANLVALDVVAQGTQSPELWYRAADHIHSLPQVENASVSNFALMSGGSWTMSVWANGRTPESDRPAYFLSVSPSWLDTLKVPLLEGRQLRADDAFPSVAIVNQTFARHYFPGRSAVGQFFETMQSGKRVATQIVGVAADARYTGMRRAVPLTVYVPFRNLTQAGTSADTFAILNVRTKDVSPLALAELLRKEVRQANPAFRVANIRTQEELIRSQTVRERLLATLSLFFGVAALVLASVGLYGVLHYAVTQRRRELGIRIALGANAREIANRVTASVFAMVGVGAAVGLAIGIFSERFIKSLLFGVKATDPGMLAWAIFAVAAAVVLAALPAVIRALRIDPASLLRSE